MLAQTQYLGPNHGNQIPTIATNGHLSGMQFAVLHAPSASGLSAVQAHTAAVHHVRPRKIFVGGLPSNANETNLRQHFGAFGSIESCIVMMDRQTGRSRGFGFVTSTDDGSVELVMKERHTILGKVVECKRAVPKEEMDAYQQSTGQNNTAQKRNARRVHRGSDPLGGMAAAAIGLAVNGGVGVANPSQMLRNPFLLPFNTNQTQASQSMTTSSSTSTNSAAAVANAQAIAYSTSAPLQSSTAATAYSPTAWLHNDALAAWYNMTLADPSGVAAAQAAQAQAHAHAAGLNSGVNMNALQSSLLNAHAADDLQKRMAALAIAGAGNPASPSAAAVAVDNAANKQSNATLLSSLPVNSSAANNAAVASASFNPAFMAWYQQALSQGAVVDQSHAQNNAALTLHPITTTTHFATVPAAAWISPASSAALSAANHPHVLAAAAAANVAHTHAQTPTHVQPAVFINAPHTLNNAALPIASVEPA